VKVVIGERVGGYCIRLYGEFEPIGPITGTTDVPMNYGNLETVAHWLNMGGLADLRKLFEAEKAAEPKRFADTWTPPFAAEQVSLLRHVADSLASHPDHRVFIVTQDDFDIFVDYIRSCRQGERLNALEIERLRAMLAREAEAEKAKPQPQQRFEVRPNHLIGGYPWGIWNNKVQGWHYKSYRDMDRAEQDAKELNEPTEQ
jgi:hypothetical protein